MKKNLILLTKYLSVGGITTGIYFALFILCWNILNFTKFMSVSLSYISFIIINFLSHRRFTFMAHQVKMKNQFIRYLSLVTFSYFLTLAIVYFVSDLLHYPAFFGVFIATAVTTLIGFLVSKKWVY